MDPTTKTLDLHSTLEAASDLARRAGHLLRERFYQPIHESSKASSYDIVTETDHEIEALIRGELLARYPAHHIVGEEDGGSGAAAAAADYFWYVDPIDGTTNFANRIPHFSVCLALADREMEPLLGVVYNPMLDELFSALRGGGAWLNGQELRVSGKDDLGQCVVCSGFAYDKWTNPDNNVREWGSFVVRTRGVRRTGSAALDLCYVGAGRFDGYWERTLNPWDALAGMLVVRNAGGRVTDYLGSPRPQDGADGRYLASNGRIHEAMMRVLAGQA